VDTLRDVDTDWMRERLEALLDLCRSQNTPTGQVDAARLSALQRQVPTARKIIETLDATLISDEFGLQEYLVGYSATIRTLERGLGLLADRGELATRLAPDAPSLVADQLHAVIWQAAATVWDTGEYKIAVQQAAVSLSVHIKAKAGSPLNERDLVAQVFKAEVPTATQSRLHFPGNPTDKNWQSRQQGLHVIAQGAFAGIRNIAVHDGTPWSGHEGLEHLAVLSVVARSADETEVRTAIPE
jgi:hypothetical protein